MKTKKLLVAWLAVFALLAAACGSDSDDTADTGETTDTETGTEEEADTEEEEAMEEDEEEAMEEEEEAPAAGGEAGAAGELLLLQWQAPSQANALLSNGTKDLLASSLVLEPLAEYAPDGSMIPALAVEVPTSGNGGVAADGLSVT